MTSSGTQQHAPVIGNTSGGVYSDANPCSLMKTFAAMAVFYTAALLLNAEGLHRNARRLPYGPLQDAVIAVTGPVHAFGRSLRLTMIRSFVERMANKQESGISDE